MQVNYFSEDKIAHLLFERKWLIKTPLINDYEIKYQDFGNTEDMPMIPSESLEAVKEYIVSSSMVDL